MNPSNAVPCNIPRWDFSWFNEGSILRIHTLSGRIGKVVASHAEGCKVARSNPGCGWAAMIYTIHEELRGNCPWGWGSIESTVMTPLSVIGCGRLQLGVPHWAASVDYCKKLIIDPAFCGSRFSTGRLLALKDFTFTLICLLWVLCHTHLLFTGWGTRRFPGIEVPGVACE